MEWGGEWDNCNSIINKYIKKKKEKHINGKQVIIVSTEENSESDFLESPKYNQLYLYKRVSIFFYQVYRDLLCSPPKILGVKF